MDRQSQIKESLQLAAEVRAIESVSPSLDDLSAECRGGDVTSPLNGERRVYFRSPNLSQHENDEQARRVMGMMTDRVRVSREVSAAREARRDHLAVRGPDGQMRNIPPTEEDKTARKGFRPVIHWGRPSWRKTESEYKQEAKDATTQGQE